MVVAFLRKILSRKPVPPALNPDNAPEKVAFRQRMLEVEDWMTKVRASVTQATIDEDFPVEHYFTPIDRKSRRCLYGRKLFISKGSMVMGRIHRHHCINFLMQGKISVTTESGKKYFEAPYVFVSGPGTKRLGYAEEDTVWTTCHLVTHSGEENLDSVEDEIFAQTYQEIGLASSVQEIEANQ